MPTVQIPYFNNLEQNSVKEYYCTDAKVGGKKITLDLNFAKTVMDQKTLEVLKNILNRLPEIAQANIKAYRNDFSKRGETHSYIEFYLEELFEEELKELIDITQEVEKQQKEILSKLELKRIGLYPDGKYGTKYFGVFDYSIKISGEFSNQLLVVKTDENGVLDHITWES